MLHWGARARHSLHARIKASENRFCRSCSPSTGEDTLSKSPRHEPAVLELGLMCLHSRLSSKSIQKPSSVWTGQRSRHPMERRYRLTSGNHDLSRGRCDGHVTHGALKSLLSLSRRPRPVPPALFPRTSFRRNFPPDFSPVSELCCLALGNLSER